MPSTMDGSGAEKTHQQQSRRRNLQTAPSQVPSAVSPTFSCVDFIMSDTLADGWNGAKYVFRDPSAETVVATGTLESGSNEGTDAICLESGCYMLRVTSGSYDSEISWTFGSISGGAPYPPRYITFINGVVDGPFQSSCPTTAPTLTPIPSPAPTTSAPSTSPVPTKPPTPAPSSSPTAIPRVEARTWDELNDALQLHNAMVNVTRNIVFTEEIALADGQHVTAFCNETTEAIGMLTLTVNAAYCATFDGMETTPLFSVTGGSILRLIGFRVTRGYRVGSSSYYGGGGGGFYVNFAQVYLTSCTISSNEVADGINAFGGGFYADNGQLYLKRCTVRHNQVVGSTRGYGGGFYAGENAQLSLTDCTISHNEAYTHYESTGGGFYLSFGSQTNLTDCSVSHNEALGDSYYCEGGGFYLYDAKLCLFGSTIRHNGAIIEGGGLSASHSQVDLFNCTISHNIVTDGASFSYYGAGIHASGSSIHLAGCTVSHNEAGFGGGFYLESYSTLILVGSKLHGNLAYRGGLYYTEGLCYLVVDDCVVWDNTAYYSATTGQGGVFYGDNVDVRNSIITQNEALEGAVLHGSGQFSNCRIACNTAGEYGGVAYAVNGIVDFSNCAIESGSAPSGAIAYVESGATLSVSHSNVTTCNADGGGASDYLFVSAATAENGISIEIDGSVFSNMAIPAISSDASPVVIRNTRGLDSTDTAAAIVLGCSYQYIMSYCPAEACTDDVSTEETLLGISCYCYPDNQKTDPSVASCLSSASVSDPVAGVAIEKDVVIMQVYKPETGSVVLQFSNVGEARMEWELLSLSNPAQLVWNMSDRNGSLAGGSTLDIALRICSAGLQAGFPDYITNFTLNTRSSEPTPWPESRSIPFSVHAFVSADADPTGSSVSITSSVAQLAAGSIMRFVITPFDTGGIVILDAARLIFFASITHLTSDTSVVCSVKYSAITNLQEGECTIPSSVCTFGATSPDECKPSPPWGNFTLDVNDAEELAVGGRRYSFTVTRCPEALYQREGKCVFCPRFPLPCVDLETSRLMPGYWRADESSSKVHECTFGSIACPGSSESASHCGTCACGYVGPFCAECDTNYFLVSINQLDECKSCDEGRSWFPTIISGVVLLTCVALITGVCVKTGLSKHILRYYKAGKVKGMIILQVCQVASL